VLFCRRPVRDWRGGEAVAIAMEGVGSPGTPESPTCRMAGNRQKRTEKTLGLEDWILLP